VDSLTSMRPFLDERRLLLGPWQSLERDVARVLMHKGFVDVRIVGGRGDHGADILGVKGGQLCVVQCKHTTNRRPPRAAIREVVEAGAYYGAQRLSVAVSRLPGIAFQKERAKYRRQGIDIHVAGPDVLLKWARTAPEYSPTRKQLRPYQTDAAEALRESLIDTGRGQLVMATGLGKTVVMAEVVSDLIRDGLLERGRVLVLAHTGPLVEQLHRSFWHQLPKWVPTHQLAGGEEPSFQEGITFATVQSAVGRMERLGEWDLVLVDEAHHVGSQTFQSVIGGLDESCWVAGVTATPWRGDGYDIDLLLGPPVFRMGIAEGLAQGFLAEVDYRLLADNIEWEVVQDLSAHGYSIKQLNRKLLLPTRDDEAARMVADVFKSDKRRGGIVYSPTGVHAHAFAGTLRSYGLRVEAVLGEMEKRDVDRLMSRFRAGELDFVATVDLFNEGVDVPDVDIIVFMRATHSRRIFVQQLGRGLRLSDEKDAVIVLDFVTDLRRVSEVLELDKAVRGASVERLGLGNRLVEFADESSGSFLREWVLDQASLFEREGDPNLDLPHHDFPEPAPPGGVQ
jgi:superfamily II DNA or RNA helicase